MKLILNNFKIIDDNLFMMKYLILISLYLIPVTAQSKQMALCSSLFASAIKAKVEKISSVTDKFKHCAVSCMLTLRCGPSDALSLGVIKEIVDVFGEGNAEWADIEADTIGINLGISRKVKADNHCINECLEYYPKHCPNC